MQTDPPTAARAGVEGLSGKYLIFALANESYGIDVMKVREIIRLTPITPLPGVPRHVRGVVNLRGTIIPVVDLRVRLGVEEIPSTDSTCVIVVQTRLPGRGQSATGLIVDAVEEVLNITAAELAEAPDFGGNLETDYLLGMAKVQSGVKSLLNVDRILTPSPSEATGRAASE
jgi:purine-binding chemotaxis protein CheW